MFIKRVALKNFKCFEDETANFAIPDGVTPGSGLNVFVGENNSGKSSLMEAIYFLRNKGSISLQRLGSDPENDEYFVELDFVGDIDSPIDSFVQDTKQSVFKSYVFEEEGKNVFRSRRSFKTNEEAKKILFYKQSTGAYSNPSGIDAPFQSFFQISNIWAHTNPENESKFGASTICGNLLSDISEKFKIDHEEQYQRFLNEFNKTFNDPTSGLQADLNQVASETQEILNEQFGDGSLRFQFDSPEPNYMFKSVKIFVNDGQETEISEKGHGMQRAVILSLLQVYAKRITSFEDEEGNERLKPHFLFIDEPELGLHPQAQKQLFEALKVLSKTHQVFITTHSENFIAPSLIENIHKFYRTPSSASVASGKDLNIDLAVNRKFFFHHHRLFFAKKAIFVEGVDDHDRYPVYFSLNGMPNSDKDFYLLAGSGDFSIFRKLCEHFKINSYFLLDVDVIAKSNMCLKNFSPFIWTKIESLNKTTARKDPSSLFFANLSPDEMVLKSEIIEELAALSIHVLPEGAIEHYLDLNCNPISGDRESELALIIARMSS